MIRFALAIALLMMAAHAFAWGNDGHRVTGYVASALLTDVARQRVIEILGNDDLAAISTVLDDDRDQFEQRHRGSSRWHYENRPVCGRPSSTCPADNCVTSQIEHYSRLLHDRHASHQQQIEALAVLVHLIGDLHQPLHLADNRDRGGNDVWVKLPREREPRRLHEAWDTSFVHSNLQRRSPSRYAQTLLNEFEAEFADWQRGDIESWAHETFEVGKHFAYGALPTFSCGSQNDPDTVISLPASYVSEARRIVAEQATKAGVRIAVVLNRELGRQ